MRDVLAEALADGERAGRSTAVILVAGDDPAAADAVRRSVFGGDAVGHLGAEHVVVLRDIASLDNAEAVARRIAGAVPARMGIAVAGPGEFGADELLGQAATALRAAATQRRAWICFRPGLIVGTELEGELRAAVKQGQLRLRYQPIVNLPDGDLCGVEALVRWEHPHRGELAPEAFVPLAERVGVIGDLGEWVLREACAEAARWSRRLPNLLLHVNVSPRQLDDPAFGPRLMDTLEHTGFFPANLVLEVTEGAVIGDPAAADRLTALSTAGIRIALDDFGTGHSSLRYLAGLPVDILKLDPAFVAELDGTSRGGAVAQAVLRLGQILHLDTVAEGVETEAQARELTLLGCQKAQGYRYARPLLPSELVHHLPADDLSEWEAEFRSHP